MKTNTLTKKIAIASILGVTLFANSALAADNTGNTPLDILAKANHNGVEYKNSSDNSGKISKDILAKLYPIGDQ